MGWSKRRRGLQMDIYINKQVTTGIDVAGTKTTT